MELAVIIFLVVLTFSLLIVALVVKDRNDRVFPLLWGFLFLAIVSAAAIAGVVNKGYNQGQIDALAGHQTYEQFLVYPKGDTIPSDTLYLKIEEQ